MRGLGANKVYTGVGCAKCRSTGYHGRSGIYELLVIDDDLRDIIAAEPERHRVPRL